MTTVADLGRVMNEWAPEALAEAWDNVGLLLGDPGQPVERVLVALDVTDGVIEEAASRGCQAIVAHHPLPFQPLRQVRVDHPQGRKIAALLRAGIGLYVAHTNFDNAPTGGGAVLAERLGLEDVQPFLPAARAGDVKLVVFTPAEALEPVLETMAAAGAGVIGAYSHCSFRSPGTGTYLPLAGARPYAGQVGRRQEADELRLEAVVPRHRWPQVVEAVRAAHPYEEMAYDVYPLENPVTPTGAGRVGRRRPAVTLATFAGEVKRSLDLATVRLVGDPGREVARVALVGGSGGDFIREAHATGADVYVTGDVRHHQALDALDLGLAVIDAGHGGTEAAYLAAWADRLRQELPQIEVHLASQQASPFRVC